MADEHDELEPGWKWWRGTLYCELCDHEWKGKIPIPNEADEPIVNMECPNCENLSGHIP